MKKILINAAFAEEVRVATVAKGNLIDFDLESREHFRTKSNIYKGVVTRVESGLEAVFVNYGEERNGFLPMKEIIPAYLHHNPNKVVIDNGTEVMVQVDKEAREDKGASLTTRVTITGWFIVLIRGLGQQCSISRSMSPRERDEIKKLIPKLDIPEGFGAIVRTAAAGRDYSDLEWDLRYLKQLWAYMQDKMAKHAAPQLLLKESDVISRTLRDYLNTDVSEIITDTQDAYEHTQALLMQIFPAAIDKLKMHTQDIPLFTHYGIENQVQTAFQHTITLPSGGRLVFDRAEAMFIIDVNSSKSSTGKNVEDTALTTNLEAVVEISRQMRLRDVGGLMVVDFIDMMNMDNRKRVEDAFRTAVRADNARIRFSNISRFGIMQLSRQRLRSSLDEFYLQKCPRCLGIGTVTTQNAVVSRIMRLLSEIAYNQTFSSAQVLLASDVHKILVDTHSDVLTRLQDKFPNKLNIKIDRADQVHGYKIVTTDQMGNENVLSDNYSDMVTSTVPVQTRRQPLIEAGEVLKTLPSRKTSIWQKLVNRMKNVFTLPKKQPAQRRQQRYRPTRRRRPTGNYRRRYAGKPRRSASAR